MKKLSTLLGLGCLVVISITSFATAQTATYQYNAANQLLQVQHADCTIISYAYDANGNRIRWIILSAPKYP